MQPFSLVACCLQKFAWGWTGLVMSKFTSAAPPPGELRNRLWLFPPADLRWGGRWDTWQQQVKRAHLEETSGTFVLNLPDPHPHLQEKEQRGSLQRSGHAFRTEGREKSRPSGGEEPCAPGGEGQLD